MRAAVKTVLLLWLSLLITMSARANIFMCKDSAGRTITSDRPIPECADRAVREYSNKGLLKKEIAAPLTPEQKRELAAQQARRKAEQAEADKQRREDRALRARYRTEDDIAVARTREAAVLSEQVAQQKKALAAAEQEWRAVQTADAAQKQAGKPSSALQEKLAKAAQNVVDTRMNLQEVQAGLAKVNAKYDQIQARYRALDGTVISD
jgi:chromosome segregation ATPase